MGFIAPPGIADHGVITYLDGTVASAPGTPASGKLRIYAKTGPALAVKNDAGAETILGAGGAGASHEIQLQRAVDYVWAGGPIAVPFDSVPIDTDAYVTTGPHTFGAITVPTGGGALIPAGLAGDYDVSAEATQSFQGTPSPWPTVFGGGMNIWVNNTVVSGPTTTVQQPPFPGASGVPNIAPYTALPLRITVAQGDVVWLMFDSQTWNGSLVADAVLVAGTARLILRKR